jgi:hypothetical protein
MHFSTPGWLIASFDRNATDSMTAAVTTTGSGGYSFMYRRLCEVII